MYFAARVQTCDSEATNQMHPAGRAQKKDRRNFLEPSYWAQRQHPRLEGNVILRLASGMGSGKGHGDAAASWL